MGCWNKTCGLSRLPITAGTEVYMVPIVQSSYHDRCYSTGLWTPTNVAVLGEYNDYGAGENMEQVAMNYVVEALRKELVEFEKGENQYHDIPVNKDGFNEEMFFAAVHEGRGKIKNYWGEEKEFDFVMIRKDIVDAFKKNYVFEEYVGDGKGTGGYGNNYTYHKWQDLIDTVDHSLNFMHQKLEESLKVWCSASFTDDMSEEKRIALRKAHTQFAIMSLPSGWDVKGNNDLRAYGALRFIVDASGYASDKFYKTDANRDMIDAIVEGDMEKAKRLAIMLLDMYFISTTYQLTRNVWTPMCGEGSQFDETQGYVVLADAVKKFVDERNEEYED